jgi:hypothetical protein
MELKGEKQPHPIRLIFKTVRNISLIAALPGLFDIDFVL